MTTGRTINIWLLAGITALSLLLAACGPDQTPAQNPSQIQDYTTPKKENPKLDSQLNQLVAAQARGEVVAFAQQMNIQLDNGSIRVVIECVSGQLEAARQAAVSAGAVVETSYGDLLQVSVPVAALTALSGAASIKIIRLPQQPVPLSK